jgi:endoglucanase Acf2
LRDLGLYLYTTEQQALSYYHFNQHPNAGVFPLNWVNPETGQKNLVIGNVWSGKLDRSTYFCAGQQSCYYENLASNTFPMTPGSFYLGLDANFVLSAYKDDAKNPCSTSDNDLNKSAYCASLLKYLALGDANEAQINFNTYFNKGKNNIDPGNTMVDTYYWIANLQHLGNVNTKLVADVPTYAVFGTEANPIVSGYNGTHQPVDIHFFNADGSNRCVIANVQPGAMQTQVCKN